MDIIALSSGESEVSAVVRGTTEAMGIQAILRDFGQDVTISLKSDATAAIGIAARQGLGRIRHIAVADLWIQQRMKAGDFKAFKVPGKENVSDLMTKALDGPRLDSLLEQLGIERLGDDGWDTTRGVTTSTAVAGARGSKGSSR